MAGRYVVLRPYVISVNDSQAPRYPTHARRHCWFIYWGGFSMTPRAAARPGGTTPI